MIWHPRPGQAVRLVYRRSLRQADLALGAPPPHGVCGVVLCAGRGPGPISALVELESGSEAGEAGARRRVVVPRGNLEEVRS